MIHRLIRLFKSACIAVLTATAPAMAADKPDFSGITTREAAEAAVQDGRLVRIHLFPLGLGGQDVPQNISYVPSEAAAALAQVTGTIERFTRDGLVNRLKVEPDYRGDSLIPVRIRIQASHDDRQGGLNPTITIW